MRVPGLLLSRQDLENGCVKCPDKPPCTCNNAIEDCVLINRDCSTCARMECVARPGISSGSKGVSKGALAGGIVGALLFLALAVGAYLWYRRTSARNKAAMGTRDVKDVPASAADVLNRPEPHEKPPMTPYSDPRTPEASLQPSYEDRSASSLGPHALFARNPFDDANSIQTAASEGTNVIPIALVGPESHRTSIKSHADSAGSNGPVRPPRSPDLDLGLNQSNVSHGNLRPNAYPPSTVSGISGMTNRHSYMSNLTYASEMLNEAPVIMTPMKGSVLGVVKAEVVNAKTLSTSSSSDTLRVPANTGTRAATSPLAATSFGPNDVVREVDESNPFDDKHSSTHANFSMSPPPTASTFRTSTTPTPNANLTWVQGAQDDGASRPVSMATQAGSVIDIGSATRVNVGLNTPGAASARAYRTTMGRLVSPSSAGSAPGTLEEQQAWALAHAQAQAQAQGGLDKPTRPVSGSSAISATADSILESFPFVPPSPISNRPIRSPPVSPLGQQSFNTGASSPLAQHTFVVAPPSPRTGDSFSQNNTQFDDSHLPAPPDRRTLGLSTGSQLSTASSGLGSFPFQIDSGADTNDTPPPAFRGRQRASLDTLALTSDLSSYPLGFDRDGPSGQKNARR